MPGRWSVSWRLETLSLHLMHIKWLHDDSFCNSSERWTRTVSVHDEHLNSVPRQRSLFLDREHWSSSLVWNVYMYLTEILLVWNPDHVWFPIEMFLGWNWADWLQWELQEYHTVILYHQSYSRISLLPVCGFYWNSVSVFASVLKLRLYIVRDSYLCCVLQLHYHW